MTTLMTAPYRTVALDRRMLAVHAEPSAHGPPSTQGGCSTPLTLKALEAQTKITTRPERAAARGGASGHHLGHLPA